MNDYPMLEWVGLILFGLIWLTALVYWAVERLGDHLREFEHNQAARATQAGGLPPGKHNFAEGDGFVEVDHEGNVVMDFGSKPINVD